MSAAKGDHVITRIPSSTYTLKWTIDKFDRLLSDKTIKSPEFYPISESIWHSELVKSSTGIQWKICNDSQTNIHVHHGISVVNFKGKLLFKDSLQKYYNCRNYYHCNLIDYSDNIPMDDSEPVITFLCHMTLTGNKIKSEITKLQPGIQDSVHNLKKLSDDLKTMYGVSLYTDVCLRVDGDILRAHRAVLCARSPVFAKMFEHELNEKETNEINIIDLESNVLKHLISFIYTGVVNESFESIFHLYYAADKYDVSDLRQRCADILLAGITVENACQVLALANQHSDDSLKKSAMEFVEFYLELIFATDGWKELLKKDSNLAAEVMNCYTEKRKMQNEAPIDETSRLS